MLFKLKYFSLFLILFLNFDAAAQNLMKRRNARKISIEQIKNLKEGALIVRLKTKKSVIDAYKNAGKHNIANKIEEEIVIENAEIVNAFINGFDFCPVYFIYSFDSDLVFKKDFENIVFINQSMIPDVKIKFDYKNFLTAEIGKVDPSRNLGTELDSIPYRTGDFNFEALVVMDQKFTQLIRPFPYYIKIYPAFSFKRSPEILVRKLNKNLHRFYNRNKKRF